MSAKMEELRQKFSDSIRGQDTDLNISFDEHIDAFGNKESLAKMYNGIAAYRKMLSEKITFINDELSAIIPFAQKNLYLMCATSGTGKSTTAANISHPLWKQKKKVLVIANEESAEDVLFRIACLELGYNFNMFKKNKMPLAQIKEVAALYPSISEYVKVIDVAANNGITTHAEGIRNILNAVKGKEFSCVLIDYWQNIKRSETHESSHYHILDNLRLFLMQYIKQDDTPPVVMFAQIYPGVGKRSTVIEDRIKMGKTIYEAATVVVEIVTDFDTSSTKFIIAKDRFGYQGKYLNTVYDNGRYRSVTEDEFREHVNSIQLGNISTKIDMGEDDTYNPEDEGEDESDES